MVQTRQSIKKNQVVEDQPGVIQQEAKKDKKWIVALLLSIFLGGLGIDRFYMGYVWQGILKLITGGGFGIWWLIDLILIATKHNFAKVNWIE